MVWWRVAVKLGRSMLPDSPTRTHTNASLFCSPGWPNVTVVFVLSLEAEEGDEPDSGCRADGCGWHQPTAGARNL